MRIGLFTPVAADGPSPELAIEIARVAEKCGFAAHTKRIRIGTGVMILSQRNPIYAAKEIASLDVGIGVGWLAEERRARSTD